VPERKNAARDVIRAVGPPVVRINGAGTSFFADDLALIRELDLAAVILPKATPEAVEALGADGPPVLAIVETAAGVRAAFETAAHPRVEALILGAVDLGAELGLEPSPARTEIVYARQKLVVDSAAAGLRAPIDVVYLDVHDTAGLEEECRAGRAMGFRGKSCIHPAHVPIVNRVFGPSEAEVAWARSVVEAWERESDEGRGVFALNGAMVDRPVVEQARRVLAEVEERSDTQ
jgi:citrate lyase subunit beta/citryl-CoA lyase